MSMNISADVYRCSDVGNIGFFCEDLFCFIAEDFDFLFVKEFALVESINVFIKIS